MHVVSSVLVSCSEIVILVVVTCLFTLLIRWYFFFQAEGGIRDLVRSRGLGDVYKRQVVTRMLGEEAARILSTAREAASQIKMRAEDGASPVSYTHLTLPTSDLV